MSDAFDNPHKLRQEIGELWPRLKLAEARLAEAEALLRDAQTYAIDIQDFVLESGYKAAAVECADRIDAYLSREQPRCSATLGNAGQCYKPEGHDGQHSLFDASIPPWEQP